MACVKQYPNAVYFDPTLVTYALAAQKAVVDDVVNDTAEVRDTSSGGITIEDTFSFESQGVTADECSAINARLSSEENDCGRSFIERRKKYNTLCQSTGEYIMATAVARVKDRCSETGEIVRECRRCYHQRSRVPEEWWLGPISDKGEITRGKAKTTPREYKPDNRVDTIYNDPYIEQVPRFYCLEYSTNELLEKEIERCIDGTAHYYDEHRYLKRDSTGGVSFCISFYSGIFAGGDRDRQIVIEYLDAKYGEISSELFSDEADDNLELEKKVLVAQRAKKAKAAERTRKRKK